MKKIPKSDNALFLRTYFGDDAAWENICAAAQVLNEDDFQAYLECVSDPEFQGLSVDKLQEAAANSDNSFVFLADEIALTDSEHPILVVDLSDEPGRTFRVIPSEMYSVENNLSIANMDFADFAENADDAGIFRGFE